MDRRTLLGLDWFDASLLGALAVVAFLPLVGALLPSSYGDVWMGADGGIVSDAMQYLSWFREAGEHVLVGSQYQLSPTSNDYLHPGVALSGLLTWLGVAPKVVLVLWQPVAVLALFAGALAYVRRTLRGRWDRRAALVLALFTYAPLTWYLDKAGLLPEAYTNNLLFVARHSSLVPWLWGYPFDEIAVGAMAGALLCYERARRGGGPAWSAAALGMLAAWFYPWAGVMTLATIAGAEALVFVAARRRGAFTEHAGRLGRPAPGALALVLVATALPVAYFGALGVFDPVWSWAHEVSNISRFKWATWSFAPAIGALAIPAVITYFRAPRSFQDIAVRLWAPASVGLFLFITATHIGSASPHALAGVTVPLSVLAVTGVRALRWPRGAARAALATALVAAVVVPPLVDTVAEAWHNTTTRPTVRVMQGERDALAYLERAPAPGGVLGPISIGQFVPAYSGRRTWIGHMIWSPDNLHRRFVANRLFSGKLPPRRAADIIRTSGARFLIAPCKFARYEPPPPVRRLLGQPRRFGCATVWEVRR